MLIVRDKSLYFIQLLLISSAYNICYFSLLYIIYVSNVGLRSGVAKSFMITFTLQGNLHVASIYAGEESVPLKGAEIVAELKYLLNLLNLCWHFSKKPFPLFLEATGYSQDDVLLQKPKAGVSYNPIGHLKVISTHFCVSFNGKLHLYFVKQPFNIF